MRIDVIAMGNLYAYSLLLVVFAGLVIVLASSEIGWRLGVRAEGCAGNNISALEQSLRPRTEFIGYLLASSGFNRHDRPTWR